LTFARVISRLLGQHLIIRVGIPKLVGVTNIFLCGGCTQLFIKTFDKRGTGCITITCYHFAIMLTQFSANSRAKVSDGFAICFGIPRNMNCIARIYPPGAKRVSMIPPIAIITSAALLALALVNIIIVGCVVDI